MWLILPYTLTTSISYVTDHTALQFFCCRLSNSSITTYLIDCLSIYLSVQIYLFQIFEQYNLHLIDPKAFAGKWWIDIHDVPP